MFSLFFSIWLLLTIIVSFLLSGINNTVTDSMAEIQGALWRIPPVDDNEPPSLDSPGLSPGSGHSRSLQLICTLENNHENIQRLVCFHAIWPCNL